MGKPNRYPTGILNCYRDKIPALDCGVDPLAHPNNVTQMQTSFHAAKRRRRDATVFSPSQTSSRACDYLFLLPNIMPGGRLSSRAAKLRSANPTTCSRTQTSWRNGNHLLAPPNIVAG